MSDRHHEFCAELASQMRRLVTQEIMVRICADFKEHKDVAVLAGAFMVAVKELESVARIFHDDCPIKDLRFDLAEAVHTGEIHDTQHDDRPSMEEWNRWPEWYVGNCDKQCYEDQVMFKAPPFLFGRGCYICAKCGYTWQHDGNPAPRIYRHD